MLPNYFLLKNMSAYHLPGIIPGIQTEDTVPSIWGAYKPVGTIDIGTNTLSLDGL